MPSRIATGPWEPFPPKRPTSSRGRPIRRRRAFLTYSNLVSTLCLCLVVGGGSAFAATHLGRATVGGAQLKAGAITGAKVKDGSLTGADIVASSLGKVPAAGHADSASSAEHAADAQHAESATRADRAGTASTAVNANHAAAADTAVTATSAGTAAALTEPETAHFLNRPGEPESGALFTITTRVGFYLDHEGVVHLQGRVGPNDATAAFFAELPPAYRPAQDEVFYGIGPKSAAHVVVIPGGSIEILEADKGELVSLDGLTWRAAS